MLNEFGVDTCGKEFNDCYEETIAIYREMHKNRDKALQMLVDIQKDDTETFKLTMLIYSLFRYDQEDPDGVLDPLVIATLLKRRKP